MSNPAATERKQTQVKQGSKKGLVYESWYDRVGEGWLANAPTVLNEETPVRLQYFRQVLGGSALGLKMLDIGVGGMGTIGESLVKQGASLTTVDRHQRTLELAEAQSRKTVQNIKYEQAPVTELPFQNDTFDAVYAFDMLEHAGPEMGKWFTEIRRVLRPGGRFIYNMPNRTATSRMMLIYIFEQVIHLNPPGHHNFNWFLKPQEMQAILSRNGLTHQHQIGFMNLKPKPIAGLKVLTRQGAPGGFKLGKDDSLVYVGYATKKA